MSNYSKRLFCDSKRGVKYIILGGMICAGLLCTTPLSAQQIPVVNPPGKGKKPDGSLEIERLEIHRLMALPSSIKRPAGPFVLVLVNETGNPKASFILERVIPAVEAAAAAAIVFDSHTPEVRHRKAGLLDLPKGGYYLKAAAKDQILCTLTIE
jgi:hypothetical protein